jgi:hypothetical protein
LEEDGCEEEEGGRGEAAVRILRMFENWWERRVAGGGGGHALAGRGYAGWLM